MQDIPISQRIRKDVKRNARDPNRDGVGDERTGKSAERITLGLVRAVGGIRWGEMPEEARDVASSGPASHRLLTGLSERHQSRQSNCPWNLALEQGVQKRVERVSDARIKFAPMLRPDLLQE
jgi:hypothetical protein